jgi:predicted nucleotidyltransferase
MDQADALAISKKYLSRLKSELDFSEAWLFGSYAKGSQHENSDIDLAIVTNNNAPVSFETEVKLMTLRRNEETLIDPHVFSKQDFNRLEPFVDQIVRFGMPIHV